MLDCHIHIERGPYTPEWIDEFVKIAVFRGLDEIWLLEHCYRLREFVPMYRRVCAFSDYIDKWFNQKAGVLCVSDYLRLIETVRNTKYPIKIKFGLEVCYFRKYEEFVYKKTDGLGFDFLVGSVHFTDSFAFDHKPEFWDGVDIDKAYRAYFEEQINLAKCGIYGGIAHPDSIKLYGHAPSFDLGEYYDELSSALARSGMYAEQNGGVYRRCPATARLGMEPALIQALKKHGVKIQTASDAYRPEDVGENIPELVKAVHGINPWVRLPLSVYENHMKSDTVYQHQTLNEIMRSQFRSYAVSSAAVLGVSGGNGLEHADFKALRRLIGVDINEEYLTACRERFVHLGSKLSLLNIDLTDPGCSLPHAELIIADLFIEYIGIGTFIKRLQSCAPRYVSLVIQKNNGSAFVSASPYAEAFSGICELRMAVDENTLISEMNIAGFALLLSEEYPLPNGKALLRLDFSTR